MDNNTNILKLKQMVQKFCEERNWDQFHTPKELAIGISTEAGELLQLFRFKTEEDQKEMMNNDHKREVISDELSDVLYFVLRFAQMYGFDLSTSLEKKIAKNNEKYSIEKSYNNNKKYNEE